MQLVARAGVNASQGRRAWSKKGRTVHRTVAHSMSMQVKVDDTVVVLNICHMSSQAMDPMLLELVAPWARGKPTRGLLGLLLMIGPLTSAFFCLRWRRNPLDLATDRSKGPLASLLNMGWSPILHHSLLLRLFCLMMPGCRKGPLLRRTRTSLPREAPSLPSHSI